MRPRISLRTMFVVTSLVAVFCYWLMLPSINATRFVAAVAAEDFQAADEMFLDPDDLFLFDWHEKHWRFKAQAELESWSFRDIMRGKRPITLQVIFGDAGPIRAGNWIVVATRAGLLKPEPTWGSGGVGGGGVDTPLIPIAPTS